MVVQGLKWTPHGIVRDPDWDNPRRRPCHHCGATVNSPCTAVRKGKRVALLGYHDSRLRSTNEPDGETTDEPDRAIPAPRERA